MVLDRLAAGLSILVIETGCAEALRRDDVGGGAMG
jgi:hypothetical protein